MTRTGTKTLGLASLWAALGILACVAGLAYWSTDSTATTLGRVEHTGTVLRRIDEVMADYSRAVAARRAYLFGGDASQLTEVRDLDASLARSVDAARALVADNQTQIGRLDSLAALLERRIADLDASVQRRRAGGTGVETPEGLSLATRIRDLLEEMGADESRLLGERDAQARREMTRIKLVELAGIFTSAVILLAAFRRLRHEIAQRQRSELGLAASEAFLASIVEHIPDMIFVKEARELRYERINRAGEELLGIERGDLVHKTDFDFLPADQAERFQARDRSTLAGRTPVDTPEERVETKKGPRWLHTKTVPVSGDHGEPEYVLGISEDVTERREAAAALARAKDAAEAANVELREARIAADAASRAKSDFLSSMSHELRTPLNAILGFAQLLERDKREPLSDRHRQRVALILAGGEHLLRLIDDILDLSRIEAGGVSVSTEPVSVVEVLGQVKTTLEPMAARQGIQVEVEASPGHPAMVSADRTRFAQILMNFGSNAIKYNRPLGKVTFVVSNSTAGHLRVSVRDTGFGIPLEKQDTLFMPFQRAGQELGSIEGTGIGLVITKRLAERMGGRVAFHSVPGEGSEFWVDMPIHEVRA